MSRSAMPLVWVYYGDHLRHPFIGIAAESLAGAGYTVCVIDRAPAAGGGRYRHVAMDTSIAASPIGTTRDGDPLERPRRGGGPPRRVRPVRAIWTAVRRVLPAALRSGLKKVSFFFRAPIEISRRRPAVIVATHPAAAAIAWPMATRHRARFVYYPFELFGEQPGEVPWVWRAAEWCILRWAIDALITQNAERAHVYASERRARVAPTIVHNYKPKQTARRAGRLRNLLGLDGTAVIVLYEGLLQVGRCLPELIQSVAYLSEDVRLVLMGEQKSWWRQHAGLLLDDPRVRGRVLIAPWVPPQDVLDFVADADVGVISYDDTVRNNVYCEPGKLSDYVLAGVPVVAPEFPTIAPVIRKYGIGATFATAQPADIAAAIREVLAVPRDTWRAALGRAGEELIWETQVPNLLTAVAGIPASSGAVMPSRAEP